ncbi:MAG: hypothetical protein R3Y46_03630 [Opitutales bacterium]
MADLKYRLTYHNGRKHRDGTIFATVHNDRAFITDEDIEQNYKGLVRYNDAVKFWEIYPPEYKKPEEPTPTEKGKE